MASEDMVFVESGPSMQLVPSSPESSNETNASSQEFPHTYSPASANVATLSLGCNSCGLAIRSKPEFATYLPVSTKSPVLQHCCHCGSCQQQDMLAKVEDSYGLLNLPPPPVCNVSTSGWLAPGARGKPKKAARTPASLTFKVNTSPFQSPVLKTIPASRRSASGNP